MDGAAQNKGLCLTLGSLPSSTAGLSAGRAGRPPNGLGWLQWAAARC